MATHQKLMPWQYYSDAHYDPQGQCTHAYLTMTGRGLFGWLFNGPIKIYVGKTCVHCGESR